MYHKKNLSTLTYPFITFLIFVINSCASHVAEHTTVLPHLANVHWGYEGKEGPEYWGTLSPDFATSSLGKHQSPIDFAEVTLKDMKQINFNYGTTLLDIINNGHTIQENCTTRNYITIDNTIYNLIQLHFHDPSEHTINGKYFDMEMHLVHKNSEGNLAVIGIFIKKGNHNKSFNPLWEHFPLEKNKEIYIKEVLININDLLPADRRYFQYDGSLTTPPCTEGVEWIVLITPIELSQNQIDNFKSIVGKNNRPVQPLNDRKVFGNFFNK